MNKEQVSLTDDFEILDFDNSQRYSFSIDSYRLTPKGRNWHPEGWPEPNSIDRAEMQRQGILKRFTLGADVICYTLSGREGHYRVYAKGIDEALTEQATILCRRFGALTIGSIRVGELKINFFDITWHRFLFPIWLSRGIDPTWDSMDEETTKWQFVDFLNNVVAQSRD